MRLHPKVPLTIVFSILRSLLLTLLLLFSLLLPGPASPFNPLSPLKRFDVYVVDQQSVCVPLLRFVSGSRVVFYCHFPDKLLSAGWSIGPEGKTVRSRGGLLRRIYRWPVDKLEEWTTGMYSLVEVRVPADRQASPTSSSQTRTLPLEYTPTLFRRCQNASPELYTRVSISPSIRPARRPREKADLTLLSA